MIKELVWFATNKYLIDGSKSLPENKAEISLINPSNGKFLYNLARSLENEVINAVSSAQKALSSSSGYKTAVKRDRIQGIIFQLVFRYGQNLALFGSLDIRETLSLAKNDVITFARYLGFYCGAADKIHGTTITFQNDFTVHSLRERLGVAAHIIPWNYLMQIIVRSISASLAMGNAFILKHSGKACLTALTFQEIAREARLPDGALNILPGVGSVAGKALASNEKIEHIPFTGSVKTAKLLQTFATKNLVPTTLELGGKSRQIVFDDSYLQGAEPYIVNAGIQNYGQTCSASRRILVQESIYENVIEKIGRIYKKLIAAPATYDYGLGPVISRTQIEIIQSYLDKGTDLKLCAEGAPTTCAIEGGYQVSPKLFETKDSNYILAQEEIFRPVQIAIPFRDEEQPIKISNSIDFGLVASVWTEIGNHLMRVAKAVKAGQIFVNNYGAGGGVRLPFGGVRKSGHGREKGVEAFYNFLQIKTITSFHR